ncbi:MAG: discoidin domain-containing protein [Gemmatimonadota bacterium]|nr:discoidin domain-containing protein [Gemmatimonadota bacterium]
MTRWFASIVLAAGGVALCAATGHAQLRRVSITVDAHDSLGTFDPLEALGSTIDGHVQDATLHIFTRNNVAAMKSANFHSISYRTRTELGMEVWHWNPHGHWSDPAHARGYWTSSDSIGAPIRVSYGFRLPRRGNSIDQANDDGYSRLTDGDTSSYWKSNPYLDPHYTHEPATSHPQWVVVDLEKTIDVRAILIRWGVPFATRYEIQYWPGEQPNGPDDNVDGAGWVTFDNGAVAGGAAASGGDARITLSLHAVPTRWVRILMHASSHSAPTGSSDPRDAMGFAMRELELYTMSAGRLRAVTRHGRNAKDQTHTFASSTDPWHRARDKDSGTEQPGIDLMFSSGITRGLPMLTPVGVLYDTPPNGAALLRYLRARRYAVPRLELGEEPDGQFASPDDFAALYIQIADSLRAVDPSISLGGPSFQDARTKVMMAWKDGATDVRSWFAHFLDALTSRGHVRDLSFISFEFYPFDNTCGGTAPQLAQVARKVRKAVEQFRADGARPAIPLLMTEYGYSPFSTDAEMDRAGAILNAEAVAEFLTVGGAQTFYYGTEPSTLDRNTTCNSWGDNTLFISDDNRRITAKNSTYHAARMVTTLWADSAGGTHTILGTRVSSVDSVATVGAYSLRRPDGRIAILVVNRDPARSFRALVSGVAGLQLEVWRFSAAEYVWHARGASGFASPNRGARLAIETTSAAIVLPPYSVTVMRER